MSDDSIWMNRRTFAGLTIGAAATSMLTLAGCSKNTRPPSPDDVAALEKVLGQKVVTPASGPEYDGARHIWNELFDRRPAIIAPCRNAKDVARCIGFAKDHGLALSVRSGGHHPAGLGMNNGGLVIDLSQMKAVNVDAPNRRVTVEPGVLVGEMDIATEAHRLVVPAAAFASVGMGGMTPGGGESWFGEFGLAVDNLLSAEMVLADGRVVRVDRDNEPDLFWAIRGGGGNFGVLTSIEFQAHPLVSPMLGMVVYPLPLARQVGMKLRDHALAAAPDFACKVIFARKPGPAMILATKTARPMADAQPEFAKMRGFGKPIQEMVRPLGLSELQQLGAANPGNGNRYFAQTHYLKDVSPELLDIAVASINSAPSDDATVILHTISSGIHALPLDATAYPHRGARFAFHAQSRWGDKKDDARNIAWVKDWWQKVLPLATGEVYGNYISETGDEMAKRAYGPHYARLAQIKRRYDPENIFNSTINIRPA